MFLKKKEKMEALQNIFDQKVNIIVSPLKKSHSNESMNSKI
jgi:hypothetical protein